MYRKLLFSSLPETRQFKRWESSLNLFSALFDSFFLFPFVLATILEIAQPLIGGLKTLAIAICLIYQHTHTSFVCFHLYLVFSMRCVLAQMKCAHLKDKVFGINISLFQWFDNISFTLHSKDLLLSFCFPQLCMKNCESFSFARRFQQTHRRCEYHPKKKKRRRAREEEEERTVCNWFLYLLLVHFASILALFALGYEFLVQFCQKTDKSLVVLLLFEINHNFSDESSLWTCPCCYILRSYCIRLL